MVKTGNGVEPRAVSVGILKGGVGKSTISINLARQLAEDHDTLFVDLDPNGHATMGLGFEEAYRQGPNLGDVVLDSGSVAPEELVIKTDYELDVFPASDELEQVESDIKESQFSSTRVRKGLVEPLLGDAYDYIIFDTPAYPGVLNNNALVASQNHILPLVPGNESLGGFRRTNDRMIRPLRNHIDVNILAIVPNMLQRRIDQQTKDRKLLEGLNTTEGLTEYVPSFARITAEEFDRIDSGAMTPPKPGIRNTDDIDKAIESDMPLLDYNPENDQLQHFEELAEIVQMGGIQR